MVFRPKGAGVQKMTWLRLRCGTPLKTLGTTGPRSLVASGGFSPPDALRSCQSACKPGSGWREGRARARDGHSSRTAVAGRLKQPTRMARSGHRSRSKLALSRLKPLRTIPNSVLLPGGVCHAARVAAGAVRSLPHLFTLAPAYSTRRGGMFSVALSLSSRPPDVIRHRLPMEPGLPSPTTPPRSSPQAASGGSRWGAERPSGPD